MKARLNIVLECYSINPILERKNRFIWLGHQNPPILEIGNSIEFLLINIQKIKLSLEDNILKPDKLQLPLPFPFTYNDFITFARKLASYLTNASSLLKSLEYMKDYILAPLMISSKEVIIGIIILDELILKTLLKPLDVLESNTYLSQINYNNKTNADNKTNSNIEWKCDILASLLAMSGNNLSARMKLYIMNCRGYIPPVLIHRMPMKITTNKFFQKH